MANLNLRHQSFQVRQHPLLILHLSLLALDLVVSDYLK